MGIRPDFRVGPFRVTGLGATLFVVLVVVVCCCGLYGLGKS